MTAASELRAALAIPDWLGYMVSSDGVVWSFRNWRGQSQRALTMYPDRSGYLRVKLMRPNGPTLHRQVHRLVCEAFHGSRSNRMHQVRHLDGNKLNNHADNLAWGTAKENAEDRDRHGTTARNERNGAAEMSDATVIAARHLISEGMPIGTVAAFLSVSIETVRAWAADQRRILPSLPTLLDAHDAAQPKVESYDAMHEIATDTLGFPSILEALEAVSFRTDALSAAQERIAALEGALKPFADRANGYDDIPPPKCFGDTDFEMRYYDDLPVSFTLGECRAARALLASQPIAEDQPQ